MYIYKYVLADIENLERHRSKERPCFEAQIELPLDSFVLSVDKQGDSRICLWAMVNPEETRKKARRYWMVMTGGEAPSIAKHVSTLLFDDGAFVLHVFEAIE